jgi:hypothetical protein
MASELIAGSELHEKERGMDIRTETKGLTVEVCGEQRLWMAGRRQVE